MTPRWLRPLILVAAVGGVGLVIYLLLNYDARTAQQAATATAAAVRSQTTQEAEIELPTPTRRAPDPTSTPGLSSSPTPGPTSTSTPAAIANQQPDNDLLLIQDGNLVRWDARSETGVILAQQVRAYAASANGERIALLRSHPAPASGSAAGEAGSGADSGAGGEQYDLDWLDLPNRRLVERLDDISEIYGLKLSPDGRRLAYFSNPTGGSIQVVELEGGAEPQTVSFCLSEKETDCQELAWGPDSQDLLWSDSRGVWLGELSAPQPAVVIAPELEITDPRGQTSTLAVAYQNFRWSPLGRFVLADIVPQSALVRWTAVLDARSGRVVEAPGTFGSQELSGSAAWDLVDGQLVTVSGAGAPAMRFYNVQATRDDLLLLVDEILVPESILPPADTLRAIALAQTGNREFSFALSEPANSLHFYRFNHKSYDFSQAGEPAEAATELIWAPFGAEVLLDPALENGNVYLLSSQESGKMVAVPGEPGSAVWLPSLIPGNP